MYSFARVENHRFWSSFHRLKVASDCGFRFVRSLQQPVFWVPCSDSHALTPAASEDS
jgi:hypothetical protein